MLKSLADNWWMVLIRGLFAVIMGVLAIMMPGITLMTLLMVYGAFTVADGITAIWIGVAAKHGQRIWWEMVATGVLAILAGLVVSLWPGLTAMVFVVMIGVFAIIRGVFEIVAAIQLRKVIDDEWMLILSGVISVAMVLLIGAFMIAIGAMMIALAMRLRHLSKRMHEHGHPATTPTV
jgi:uncharacterized membrane protein HdeD (DUF308 family)